MEATSHNILSARIPAFDPLGIGADGELHRPTSNGNEHAIFLPRTTGERGEPDK